MRKAQEDILAHYGILGMKWGIRRFQPYPKKGGPTGNYVGKKPAAKQGATSNSKRVGVKSRSQQQRRPTNTSPRKNESYDHAKARSLEKRKTKSLSNRELEELTRRLDLEKKYSDLSPKQKSLGQKVVTDMLTKGITKAGSKIIENRILELTGDKPKYKAPKPNYKK